MVFMGREVVFIFFTRPKGWPTASPGHQTESKVKKVEKIAFLMFGWIYDGPRMPQNISIFVHSFCQFFTDVVERDFFRFYPH